MFVFIYFQDPHLVISETLESNARHMFSRFDPEGKKFNREPSLIMNCRSR